MSRSPEPEPQNFEGGVLVKPEVTSPKVERINYKGHTYVVLQAANEVAICYASGEAEILSCLSKNDTTNVFRYIVEGMKGGQAPGAVVEEARAEFSGSLT
ncbi:MAG: hypothetical protein COY81_00640 [Candidatus Pacebacteria bacterium CG_4_10_14_0_8_um_filter_43_12]|nr:MAG: hypothetical protein COY81_00640 [Candidatus Pacebacteria bacterium CG_4_10_14_0_8_um_filter_43_12]